MAGVSTWFEERGEVPLVPPPGLREYAPLSDDAYPGASPASDHSLRGLAFGMEYCDTRGWASTRTVRCLSLDRESPARIEAFCHARQSVRSFRIDRIISIFDLRSGAILSGEAHAALLAPYLGTHEDGSAGLLLNLQKTTRSGVFALLHIAMKAGTLSAEARTHVLDYVASEAAAVGCPMPASDAVELWIDNLAPPVDAVVACVDDLLSGRDRFARVLPWLMKVVRSSRDPAQDELIRQLIEEVRAHYKRQLMSPPAHLRATR